MCDEHTAIEEEAALAARGLSRREFAAIGAAGVLAACTASEGQAAKARATSESMVKVTTPDGTADAFFVHPARGKAPAVIMWPDIAGLRDAYKAMARRLAGDGFAVLAVNPYYRTAQAPLLETISQWRTPEGQARLKPALEAISVDGIKRDAAALVAWLDRQQAVDKRRGIGTQGYCMTGAWAIRTAATVPERVRAAASFHGGGLVTDKPDSPHRLLEQTRARFLIAIARNDDAKAPTDKDALREAAKKAGRPAEIEVYAADHGWCTLDAPVYDKAEADRAWTRLLALYKRL